jgi:hypothetical protein
MMPYRERFLTHVTLAGVVHPGRKAGKLTGRRAVP